MSIPIVIDEWLFADLSGENEELGDRQLEALHFLGKLVKVRDKIVILEGSPFQIKMRRFMSQSRMDDPLVKGIVKFLSNAVLTNSDIILSLSNEDLKTVPKKLTKVIPLDDFYLFQEHLSVKNSFILTTDGRWDKKIMQSKLLKIEMRDPFIKDYLVR